MPVSVRDTLEKLGLEVSYDEKTGGVLVKNKKGENVNIGSEGFELSQDGRYYADNAENIYSALLKNNLSPGPGWKAARNYLSPTEYVGYDEGTKQIHINGKSYNIDNENLVNIGGTVYGRKDFLDSLKTPPKKESGYKDLEEKVLRALFGSSYGGWDARRDAAYQNALGDYIKNAKSDMGERGLVSDSLAAHYAAQGARELSGAFAAADYEKYAGEKKAMLEFLGEIGELKKAETQDFEAKQRAESDRAKMYLSREEMAADNKKRLQERQWEIEDDEREIEKYKRKAEIDFDYWQREFGLTSEQAVEAMKIKSELDIDEAAAAAYYKFLYGNR